MATVVLQLLEIQRVNANATAVGLNNIFLFQLHGN